MRGGSAKKILAASLLSLGLVVLLTGCAGDAKAGAVLSDETSADDAAPAVTYAEDIYSYKELSEDEAAGLMLTEKEAVSVMEERGFREYELLVKEKDREYSAEGKDDIVHPRYETLYSTPDGEKWNIILIGNSVQANPVLYNITSLKKHKLLVVEEDIVLAYDYDEEMFMEIGLSEKMGYRGIRVEKVDAETLRNLEIMKHRGEY